jgi:hypothetical protein
VTTEKSRFNLSTLGQTFLSLVYMVAGLEQMVTDESGFAEVCRGLWLDGGFTEYWRSAKSKRFSTEGTEEVKIPTSDKGGVPSLW